MTDLELREVADRYSQMSESELMDLARKYEELAEPAKAILREEFARRSLQPPLIDEGESSDEVESRTLVTVRKFRDLPEAFIARSVLENAGIQCFLQDENTVRTDWLWSNMIGGARLQVAAQDEAEANEILSQPIPPSFSVDSGENFQQPVCPQCGSLNVMVNDGDRKLTAATTLILGVPLNAGRQPGVGPDATVWKCLDCGCKWEDDGEAARDASTPVN